MIDRLLRRLSILLVLVALACVLVVARFLIQGGLFHRVVPHGQEACTGLDLHGEAVADIAIDQANGIAYVATLSTTARDPVTAIKQIDLKAVPLTATPALPTAPQEFQPESLMFAALPDGKKYLFAVNRQKDERFGVEVFAAEPGRPWSQMTTLRDTRFKNPGDITAVTPDRFYLTNRSPAENALDRLGEMLLGQGHASIVYHDGARSIPALANTPGAEGIGIAPTGDRLYAAETLTRRIQIYDREPYSGMLTAGKTIALPGAPHRIDVAPDGSLWIAADPAFRWNDAAPAATASQVLHVTNPATDPDVTEAYAARPDQFAGATVAAAYGKTLLIGSPAESRLQVCTLP
jgi:hypothetical protein